MDQKDIMRLLENMMEGADQLVDNARKENAEANNPESDNYIIRDCKYATLQYFSGYKQGISLVMRKIRKYFWEEEVKQSVGEYIEDDIKNLKLKSAALYGESVKEG